MSSFFGGPPAPLGGSGNGSQDTGDAGRGEGGSAQKKAKRDDATTGSCVNLSLSRASFVTTPLACLSIHFFFLNRTVYCGTLDSIDEMSLTYLLTYHICYQPAYRRQQSGARLRRGRRMERKLHCIGNHWEWQDNTHKVCAHAQCDLSKLSYVELL
jgi:hypothetical protein